MIAEFVEVALVANVGGKTPRSNGQARLPTPGELFPAFGIAVEIGQFGTAVEEIVSNRTAVQPDRSGRETQENRNVQVLISFRFDYFPGAGFSHAEIGAVGVKNEFRLNENCAPDTRPGAELRAELDIINTEIKSVLTVADRNVVRAGREGLKAAFYTESELRTGSSGAAKEDGYQKQVFHTCSILMPEKRRVGRLRTQAAKKADGLTIL